MRVHNVSHEYLHPLLSQHALVGDDGVHTMDVTVPWQTALFDNADDMRGLGVLARYVVVVCKQM